MFFHGIIIGFDLYNIVRDALRVRVIYTSPIWFMVVHMYTPTRFDGHAARVI